MLSVIRKTQAEIDGHAVEVKMTQRQYNEKYMRGSTDTLWHCDVCNVLLEDDDDLIERTWKGEHSPHCAQIRTMSSLTPRHWWAWWKAKIYKIEPVRCNRRLMCSSKDYFEKNYHLKSVPHKYPTCKECGCSVVEEDGKKCPWGHIQPI